MRGRTVGTGAGGARKGPWRTVMLDCRMLFAVKSADCLGLVHEDRPIQGSSR